MMKVSDEHYAVMKEGMQKVWSAIPEKGEKTYHWLLSQKIRKSLWELWYIAFDDLTYDDTHPYYVSGRWTRIVPHNPDFAKGFGAAQYKDAHITTALKRIAKELNLPFSD